MSQAYTTTEKDDDFDRIEVIFTAPQIKRKLRVLAKKIASIALRDVIVISIMKGSFIFTADLIRELHVAGLPLQVDFMSLSSYHSGTQSTGHVKLIYDINVDVTDCDVILVDDILQSGRTLHYAKKLITERNARKILTCVLLNKPVQRAVPIEADFIGFECPADLFVVGYGLDKAFKYRQLPFIGYISTDH